MTPINFVARLWKDGKQGGTPITAAALNRLEDVIVAIIAAVSSKADLVAGKVPVDQLPERAIVRYLGSVASQSAMLALGGDESDWCVRTDTGTHWVIVGSNPTQIGSWKQIPLPLDAMSKAVADASYAPANPDVVINRDSGGVVTSVVENGLSTVLTRNSDGSLATVKRGDAPTKTVTRNSAGQITGVSA
ncbi:hypothetical protein OG579_17075 [Williamsia herbipolensis]|uniref:Uncharacterized protein n=1 Tax=Williamsia herbipolensis TaxID=1603258 RepID=A0AAU4K031_9NOCA|nr:hypothetical protein [Williamsia herbipolensis]